MNSKKIIGSHFIHAVHCRNSLEWARENIHRISDGAVFFADHYDYLRGRQERVWIQKAGQIIITIILKPNVEQKFFQNNLNYLNMAFTQGIYDALASYHVGIKWPNDFMINQKKVGGQLVQAIWTGEKLGGVVAGFAINANTIFTNNDELFPIATSLRQETDQNIDEEFLRENILASLDVRYAQWTAGDTKNIFRAWKASQMCLNRMISVHQKDGTIVTGLLQDVNVHGDAMICDSRGTMHELPFYVVENVSVDF